MIHCSIEMKSLKDFLLSDQIETSSVLNLALIDPPRWGFSAAAGIVDLSTPHVVCFDVSIQIMLQHV